VRNLYNSIWLSGR